MSRASTATDGRAALALMREALVEAKVAVSQLHEAVADTRRRLAAEREALETVQRRGRLAADINDAQTVAIASEYERRHLERTAVLDRKLAAQLAELELTEREVAQMTRQFKADGAAGAPIVVESNAPEPDLDAQLKRTIDRGAREAEAEQMLAELKRRMGR
ncbi:MAG: hypothetical protein M3373_12375 [Gemmatimonadota bacterium]|nr:hypothetical protein [Gemmatimonadota bacterium]